MFKDYYLILEIVYGASQDEIRNAYRKQAKYWHPDRNSGNEALKRMQEINEAYLILKDQEARERYDKEYVTFTRYRESLSTSSGEQSKFSKVSSQKQEEYVFQDELLRKWVKNAREQAAVLVNQTLNEFKRGSQAALQEMYNKLISFLVVGAIMLLIFTMARGCS